MTFRRLAVASLILQVSAVGLTHAAATPTGLVGNASELAGLPEARLPAALVREQLSALKQEPLRFAVPATLNLDQRNGSWDTDATGKARWRLRIASDGASSLALLLTQVTLPEGATLWFYDASGNDVQGPFDRHSTALINGRLPLPLVRSSAAVLEVLTPLETKADVAFKLAEAYHGYRNLLPNAANTPKAAIGRESDSCNINVVCPEGNNWRDEIRATVLLTIDSQAVCSGTLVNNTRRDDRPLILTANHCDIRSSNISRVTAYFNVQSTSCGGNQNGRVDQNIVANTLLARDENSDFTLFSLASLPLASYNVFYAGWDARTGVAPQSGVAIHHPQGDEKKISAYSAPGEAVEDVEFRDNFNNLLFSVDAWRVNWTAGTTEPASSGSALWNQNKQVVGVLSGGSASCNTPNEPDFFGRFERGYTANAAASGQLKAHLDPLNTGCLQLASKNPGSASPLASCTATPTPTLNPTPSPTPDDGSESSGGSFAFGTLAMLLIGAAGRRKILVKRG